MSKSLKISFFTGLAFAFVGGFFLPFWAGIPVGVAGMFIAAGIQDWKGKR